MKIIFCAPDFDIATSYSAIWCETLIDYADTKPDVVFFALREKDAIRQKVEDYLNLHPDAIFCFFNHGNEDSLLGNDAKPAIDLNNNSLLKNREVMTMACLSSKMLGADSYLRYGTIYFGSYDVISFTTDAIDEFGEALTFPMELRIDDESDWNSILDKTIMHDNEVIDLMLGRGKVFGAALMRQNRDARRVWTDKTPPSDQPSNCVFRRLALKLLGKRGWRIPKPNP